LVYQLDEGTGEEQLHLDGNLPFIRHGDRTSLQTGRGGHGDGVS